MSKYLNEFEIKAIKNHFKEVEFLGVVFHSENVSASYYAFYYKYKGILCAAILAYNNFKSFDNTNAFAKLMEQLQIKIKAEIMGKESVFFKKHNPEINDNLYYTDRIVSVFENINDYLSLTGIQDYTVEEDITDKTKNIVLSKLDKGINRFSIYNELFELNNIDIENIYLKIINYKNPTPQKEVK